MVKKEISSDENWKEALWETALCSVNSSYRITAFPSRSRSLRLFLWNFQRDIWKPIEAYGEKENILKWNMARSFLRNSLWCVTSTLWVTAVFPGAVCKPYCGGIWELSYRIPLKTKGPKEISSVKSAKEAFWETSLWSVNSSHRITAFPSRSLSLRLFLWNCKVIFGVT